MLRNIMVKILMEMLMMNGMFEMNQIRLAMVNLRMIVELIQMMIVKKRLMVSLMVSVKRKRMNLWKCSMNSMECWKRMR
jgi:hypothetical protein